MSHLDPLLQPSFDLLQRWAAVIRCLLVFFRSTPESFEHSSITSTSSLVVRIISQLTFSILLFSQVSHRQRPSCTGDEFNARSNDSGYILNMREGGNPVGSLIYNSADTASTPERLDQRLCGASVKFLSILLQG